MPSSGASGEEGIPAEAPRERKWVNILEPVCEKSIEQLQKEWGPVGIEFGIQVGVR